MIISPGQRFGRLVVIRKAGKANSHGVLWECKCDCGKIKLTRSNYLTIGATTSCGCYASECSAKKARKMGEEHITHGMTRTRLYRIWNAMKNRCRYPSQRMYPIYGGKGICVCDEWKEFEPFKNWAYENGYAENLCIDRIDGNKNYCPENCRWVTQKQNNRNKKNLIYLTVKGETKLLVDWAKETGQQKTKLYYRHYAGWNDRDVVYGR